MIIDAFAALAKFNAGDRVYARVGSVYDHMRIVEQREIAGTVEGTMVDYLGSGVLVLVTVDEMPPGRGQERRNGFGFIPEHVRPLEGEPRIYQLGPLVQKNKPVSPSRVQES